LVCVPFDSHKTLVLTHLVDHHLRRRRRLWTYQS
jgi:hypothetical protein